MAGRGGHGTQTTEAHLPAPPARPPGLWLRAAVDFPRPPTPFTAAWLLPGLSAAGRPALRALGAMVDRVEYRAIDGYVYRRIVPFGPVGQPLALFRPIARALVRIRPATRQRLNVALRAMRTRSYEEALDRWDGEWRKQLVSRAAQPPEAEIAALDDRTLDQRIEAVVRLSQEGFRIHARVVYAAAIAVGRFIRDCRAAGIDDAQTFAALLRPASSMEDVERDATEAIGNSFPLGREAAMATPAEANLVVRNRSAGRGGAAAAAIAVQPAEMPDPYVARRAHRALQEAEALALDLPLALVRQPVRELGRRLAERAQLARADDVFMLTPDEARAGLRSGEPQIARAADRQSAREQAVDARPAAVLGSAPPWPLDLLPGEAREMVLAMLAVFEGYEGRGLDGQAVAEPRAGSALELEAIGVAPGSAGGGVRQLRVTGDLAGLPAAGVAVCRSATYGLAPFVSGCSGLVAAYGGPLSPVAVVAQALRIPAVTGYPIETLADGTPVDVDGDSGSVRPAAGQAD